MKTIGAGQFKAKCLAMIDEVAAKKVTVVITKKGKPKAKLVPIDDPEEDPLAIFKFGKGVIVGDVVSPASDLDDWEALK